MVKTTSLEGEDNLKVKWFDEVFSTQVILDGLSKSNGFHRIIRTTRLHLFRFHWLRSIGFQTQVRVQTQVVETQVSGASLESSSKLAVPSHHHDRGETLCRSLKQAEK